MRTVELTKGIYSSVLGFGCASVLGATGSRTAKNILHYALDNGINHLDLDRSYGYGEAEEFVGRIVKGRRDKMVLVSKFGIEANWVATLFRPVKPLVRIVRKIMIKQAPELEPRNMHGVANMFHERIPINGKEMRKSLEKSLKALKTDYLDYYMLHDPKHYISLANELAEVAGELKKEGKIRAWGISFDSSKKSMHEKYLHLFDLCQFNNSPGAFGYEQMVSERSHLHNIIFSPIRSGAADIKPAQKLTQLVTDFPKSVMLCSTFNKQHLEENIAAVNSHV